MKNTLADLNNYLFEALERLTDDDMDEAQLQKEITRSKAVTDVAEAIVHTGELALKAAAKAQEYGFTDQAVIPAMLGAGKQ
jgi:hypothetical protein